MLRRHDKRGRPRKAGRPKLPIIGSDQKQAAERRYQRAVHRMKYNPDTFRTKHLNDITTFLNLIEQFRAHRYKLIATIKKYIEQAKRLILVNKVKAKAGKNKKKVSPKAAPIVAQYAEIIDLLLQGEEVKGYTLLRAEKAKTNHTVIPLVDVGNQVLCKIKDEHVES